MSETRSTESSAAADNALDYDAVVVGAGFAGLYMLYKLRELGLRTRVYEAGSGVGGTWYWNRYPGARCDVESMEYSYQFSPELQQDWEWSERYATQPEILRYVNHVADRFELRDDIQFDTKVESAHFDEEAGCWRIATDQGDRVAARFCIMATGCLSSRNMPRFLGMEEFKGEQYHTGNWPHTGVDFDRKRVAVIGTGSSAIQAIPIIAKHAAELFVFQRTPNFSIPARNHALDPDYQAEIKANYDELRAEAAAAGFGIALRGSEGSAMDLGPEERRAAFEAAWEKGGFAYLGSFADLVLNQDSNDAAADFVREKIRETVDDPEVAEALCPTTTIGCKRLCLDTGYFETFNRPNVHLIDIRESGIEGLTERGVRAQGEEYEVDMVVFATGFDAMTGALLAVDIRGRDGQTLAEKWEAGPRTYLGLATVGFPNLFTITGPGSPSVLTNMLPSIEQHVNWIADCVDYLREHELAVIEPEPEAEEAWVDHCNEVAGGTLLLSCNSWYLGSNIPGKARVFMPYLGFPPYVEKCNEVASHDYEGFTLAPAPGEVGAAAGS